jgi:hypothetical protein
VLFQFVGAGHARPMMLSILFSMLLLTSNVIGVPSFALQ